MKALLPVRLFYFLSPVLKALLQIALQSILRYQLTVVTAPVLQG